MKNKKIVITISIVVIVLVLITFGILKLKKSIENDKLEAQKKVAEVNQNYDEFVAATVEFNTQRSALETTLSSVFYNTLSSKNDEIIETLQKYDDAIGNIIKSGNNLTASCQIYFVDKEVQQKCINYKTSYESAVTVFKNDVAEYNELVKSYNEWTKNNTKYKTIETYKSSNIEES